MGLWDFQNEGDRVLSRISSLEQGNLRLRRGSYGPVTGPLSRVSNEFLDPVGKVDPTKSAVVKKGSMAPTGNTNGFAYTSTTSSITWYWDGTNGSRQIILRRIDSTVQVIPAGSITVSGLAANTTYYFFPFWAANNQCTIGFVIGTHGSPQIAFIVADLNDLDIGPAAAVQQNLQDREALTAGAMTGATTAAGTGGGGAGGGGDGGGGHGCVMSGTDIQPLGDWDYVEEVVPETEWVRLVAGDRQLCCTHDHPLFHAYKGKVVADTLEIGDLLLMDDGEHKVEDLAWFSRRCTKRIVRMDKGHLFYANGFLSHNKFNVK